MVAADLDEQGTVEDTFFFYKEHFQKGLKKSRTAQAEMIIRNVKCLVEDGSLHSKCTDKKKELVYSNLQP